MYVSMSMCVSVCVCMSACMSVLIAVTTTCFKRTGSRAGSSSVPTFSNKQGLPNRMAFSRLLKKSLSDNFIMSRPFSFSCDNS